MPVVTLVTKHKAVSRGLPLLNNRSPTREKDGPLRGFAAPHPLLFSFPPPCRTAVSTFKDFELASSQQRPDTVLRQRFREQLRVEERAKSLLTTKPRTNRFVKLAVMGLTVMLGAAAVAVVKSALEWAPKFELQIFP